MMRFVSAVTWDITNLVQKQNTGDLNPGWMAKETELVIPSQKTMKNGTTVIREERTVEGSIETNRPCY